MKIITIFILSMCSCLNMLNASGGHNEQRLGGNQRRIIEVQRLYGLRGQLGNANENYSQRFLALNVRERVALFDLLQIIRAR